MNDDWRESANVAFDVAYVVHDGVIMQIFELIKNTVSKAINTVDATAAKTLTIIVRYAPACDGEQPQRKQNEQIRKWLVQSTLLTSHEDENHMNSHHQATPSAGEHIAIPELRWDTAQLR